MTSNFYMLEQMAASIDTNRRQDANAYRLWKNAIRTIVPAIKHRASKDAR